MELPDDPYRLVSGADCRLIAFKTVNEATQLWIKGREFTVARLLGDTYKGQAERYLGGAVAAQVRIGAPLFSTVLAPIYVALFLWGGLYLRDERVRALIPLRR